MNKLSQVRADNYYIFVSKSEDSTKNAIIQTKDTGNEANVS